MAAHRLDYERVETPYGDPAADEALTRDVADGLHRPPGSPRHEYLRARTAFFDRVVVTSLDHRVRQVVTGGAGYDGRAFRYARQGVRWFEVDHPATQADKLARIGRLGLDSGQVLERVLGEFRAVTPARSPLAISVSRGAQSESREQFQAAVAAAGEPVRSALSAQAAAELLARQAYSGLTAAIEDRWRSRFGADRVAAPRDALEPLAAGDPAPLFGGLTPYPEGWRARVRPPAVLPHYPMLLHRGAYPDGA